MDIAKIKDDNERLRKYRKHGFTKEALKDENPYIRQKAKEYFKNKGE